MTTTKKATEPLQRGEPSSVSLKKRASKYSTGGETLFYEIEDGLGAKFKVANMRNTIVCKREGIIEVEVIRKSNNREPKFSMCNAYDREMGVWFGVVLGIDHRTKELRWQRISVGDRRTYDLSKFNDAVEWAILSRSAVMEGSPYQSGKPLYRVFDREKEAQEYLVNSTLRTKAMEIVAKIKLGEMSDFYRCFGRNPEGLSPTRLQVELTKIAERTPKEFYNMWNSANRELVLIFNRCLTLGIITYYPVKGYFYKDGITMGLTEAEAMIYLENNKQILQAADMESKHKLQSSSKELSAEEKKFFGDDGSEEEDPELIEMRAAASMLKIVGFQKMKKEDLLAAVEEKTRG